jgi:hypothetical protein
MGDDPRSLPFLLIVSTVSGNRDQSRICCILQLANRRSVNTHLGANRPGVLMSHRETLLRIENAARAVMQRDFV